MIVRPTESSARLTENLKKDEEQLSLATRKSKKQLREPRIPKYDMEVR